MVGLSKKILDAVKKMVGFVVEHACVRTETGLGSSNEDLKGLVGVQVEQVGEWGWIRRLLPSQNV